MEGTHSTSPTGTPTSTPTITPTITLTTRDRHHECVIPLLLITKGTLHSDYLKAVTESSTISLGGTHAQTIRDLEEYFHMEVKRLESKKIDIYFAQPLRSNDFHDSIQPGCLADFVSYLYQPPHTLVDLKTLFEVSKLLHLPLLMQCLHACIAMHFKNQDVATICFKLGINSDFQST
jgi:hypothetical protein